jgi:hypothetical protein
MCASPVKYEKVWKAVEERPAALGTAVSGGIWLAKDLPMLLHTFEYIARYALNAWWSAMAVTSN